jgi:hypothetical protein
MRSTVLLAVFSLLSLSADAFGQSPPFGLSWGPVENVPRPSLATREDNVTLLMFRGNRIPRELRDTEEIVLEVCKKEGLQQIIWISRFLSDFEAREKFEAVLTEGIRRYGKAESSEQGIIYWSAGRTMVTTKPFGQDLHRILMTSTGPGFSACSEEHKSMTGHPLDDHWMRFLPNNSAR